MLGEKQQKTALFEFSPGVLGLSKHSDHCKGISQVSQTIKQN